MMELRFCCFEVVDSRINKEGNGNVLSIMKEIWKYLCFNVSKK